MSKSSWLYIYSWIFGITKNCLCMPLYSHTCFMPYPFHSPWLVILNYRTTYRGVQMINFIVQFPSEYHCLIPSRHTYSQQSVLKHLHPMFFLKCQRPLSDPYETTDILIWTFLDSTGELSGSMNLPRLTSHFKYLRLANPVTGSGGL
jgi:hypothetical protein